MQGYSVADADIMDMRKALSIPILLACAPHAMGQVADQPAGKQSRILPKGLDLHVDQQEHIEVHGRKPRFIAAPTPGYSSIEGPSARAVYDPKTGASIGEFGWAYVLAAP